ncbi:hypothetical protein HN51_048047 [Arachis hypogaea]
MNEKLINGLCKIGHTIVTIKLMQELKRQPIKLNVVMYSTVIDGLCKEGLFNEIGKYFFKMIAREISPDVISYSSLIHGLCCVNQLEETTKLLNQTVQTNIKPNLHTYNMHFVRMEMPHKPTQWGFSCQESENGLESYNIMIDGYCKKRIVDKAMAFFNEMLERNLVPNTNI